MDIRPAYGLRTESTPPPAEKIQEAARQLESQFARMMIKSMRDASFGDPLFPEENQLFRDMYDDKLAQSLTQGRGLGMQEAIIRQLGGKAETEQTPQTTGAMSLASLSQGAALRAYQAQMPLTSQLQQAAELAPLSAALDAIAGRDSHPSADGSSGMSDMNLMAMSSQDWSRNDDRWQPRVADTAPVQDLAARQAAAQLGTGTPEAFVASIWPHAQRAAADLGVNPRALVAQAALETAWGKRLPTHGDGRSANNLFGIKATGWKGEAVRSGTHEFVGGQRRNETASFRSYSSVADSFNDYVRLLKNSSRYQGALAAGTDITGFAKGLQRGGYATDPGYANKIATIADGSTINRALSAIEHAQTNLTGSPVVAMNR